MRTWGLNLGFPAPTSPALAEAGRIGRRRTAGARASGRVPEPWCGSAARFSSGGGSQPGSLGCLSHGVGLPEEKGPSWAHWGVPDSGRVLLATACLSGPLILGGGVQAGDACTLSSRPTPSMDSRDPASPPPLGPTRVTQSPSSEIPQPLCLCSWDHLRATEGGDQSSVTTDVGQGRLILTPVATGASPAQPPHTPTSDLSIAGCQAEKGQPYPVSGKRFGLTRLTQNQPPCFPLSASRPVLTPCLVRKMQRDCCKRLTEGTTLFS